MTTGPTQYDVSSAATQTGIHTHADLVPGTLLGGRYRIEAILGIGGMGVVYRASDLTLGVDVALKLLRPELAHRDDVLDRFRQELLLARQVSSPHVVRIHDLAQHDGHWLISMDYVDGESLDHRIDREGPLPLDDALRIIEQIAQGLVDAHAKGVVHRDLKPANILLDTQGQAYIADFGVARSLATSGMLQTSMTRAGSVVGTPDYLSPEQARGETADARSDLYAVGLILYEMLAGKLPFSGGTTAEVLAQRMLRAPAPLSRERDVPAWVARLVDRLLRPQPAHRLQSAGEILDALKHRELRRDMRSLLPQLGRWGAMAVVVAVLLVAGSALWLGKRAAPPLPASPASQVAVAQPLDRLLVLPITGDASAEVMAALSADLRDVLASRVGLAVVDGERTALALGQWYPDDRTQVDVAAVQRSVGGQRALHVQLRQQQGQWKADARLHVVGRPVHEVHASAQDPTSALRALLATADFSGALQVGNPPITLAATGALEAYGAGLLARRKGKLAEALAHFTAATAAAPGDAALWLAQAQAALAIGDVERAADAIEQGQRASNKVPASVARHLAAQRASIDGDADAAVEQWRAALAATPDDGEA
ncbi:MAG: serine/threonine-protein kinase, partial [Thermomonas sp.]